MKKLVTALLALLALGVSAQNNPDYRLPEPAENPTTYRNYNHYKTGFWIAAEAGAGYMAAAGHCSVPAEVTVEGGYRFSDYIRVGLGAGFRYYTDNASFRHSSSACACPIYLTARGNFMTHEYRSVVPFWDVDAGYTAPDGMMLRPSVGIRVGRMRQAFTLSVSYLGQSLQVADASRKFASGALLRLGYEF